jgi:DDE superfamily endonuclease
LRRRLARLRRAHPDQQVEVWAEDEARFGLKPVCRRVWAPRGRRPACSGRARYEWLYVYGFARPGPGGLVSVALPRVTAAPRGAALAAFAARADPAGCKLLVGLGDPAGWHVAKRLVVPAHVVLQRLPPGTPELQPVEPLWPLLREAVANREFERLAQLRRVLRRRCGFLAGHPDIVKGAVGFRWAAHLET